MKKNLTMILVLTLVAALLAGCSGAQVHICPTGEAEGTLQEIIPQEGALRTGLAVLASVADSASAGEEEGTAKFDVTLVAVAVDDGGVIRDCAIDGVKTEVKFTSEGEITTPTSERALSKYELREDYGMKAYGGAKYEWYEQVQALADYAVGKTVEELKNGAVGQSGEPGDADLASVATIYLGGFVQGIEEAAANARHLGAQAGDELVLTTVNSRSSSVSAMTNTDGKAQLDCNIAVVTMNGDTITSCLLDSLQAVVSFDGEGRILSDLTAPLLTKNALGEDYGMKMYAGSAYEWNEQAAAFAEYVTGKTPQEVEGIAVGERNQPVDADLASTVTISVGGFMELIRKAAMR